MGDEHVGEDREKLSLFESVEEEGSTALFKWIGTERGKGRTDDEIRESGLSLISALSSDLSNRLTGILEEECGPSESDHIEQ